MNDVVKASPEIALFLSLAIGVWLGRRRVAGVSLGNAASVLIVATVLGAVWTGPLGIQYPALLKTVAFGLFVFCVGFQGGPQFFASLSRRTVKQVVLAVFLVSVGLLTTLLVAKLWGFDKGTAAGIGAGGLTETAMLATAVSSLSELGLSAVELQAQQANAAVAFALTYIFGAVAVIVFIPHIAPRLLGIDLKQEAATLEAELFAASGAAQETLAYRRLEARAYRVGVAAGASVAEIESMLSGGRSLVESVRRAGRPLVVEPGLFLQADDEVVVAGHRAAIVKAASVIGPELEGYELLAPVQGVQAEVVITQAAASGRSLGEATATLGAQARGVFLKALRRGGVALPITPATELMRGDVLTLIGSSADVERVTALVGKPLAHGESGDLAYLGLGLVAGTLLGLLGVHVGGIPVELGAGGGVLIAGLLFGWYNSRHPLVGYIPHHASRGFWDIGLAMFVALIGLNAGPQALDALREQGGQVLMAGAIVTLVPQVAALYFGRYVLRMHPVYLCGALAGAQTQDAAMVATNDAAESATPVLGFTVPYAVGNVGLTLIGPLVVALV
ncbi:aspartate:alanine exchanger family transporter [Uliginosibacterium sp. H1]|uniref:aspartate:alanine exchanger family transporter n=1 Tax=Uliginosibacterium sp. H1 TaxID=3114757 RepID=UPI002E194EB8|nr:TrkA C-terminal domain-containing protein [Uliginosibacterium sp. H1]